MDIKEDIKRWRLILGKDTEEDFSSMDSEAISSFSEEDWLMSIVLLKYHQNQILQALKLSLFHLFLSLYL